MQRYTPTASLAVAVVVITITTLDVTEAFVPGHLANTGPATAVPTNLYLPLQTAPRHENVPRQRQKVRLLQEPKTSSSSTTDDAWISKGYENGTVSSKMEELLGEIKDDLDQTWEESLTLNNKDDDTMSSQHLQSLDAELDELAHDINVLQEHQDEVHAYEDLSQQLEQGSLDSLEHDLDELDTEIEILQEHQREIHALEQLAEQLAVKSVDVFQTSIETGPAAKRLEILAQQAKESLNKYQAEVQAIRSAKTKSESAPAKKSAPTIMTKQQEDLKKKKKSGPSPLLGLSLVAAAAGGASVVVDPSLLAQLELPQDLLNNLDMSSMLDQLQFHLPPAIQNLDPSVVMDQVRDLQLALQQAVATAGSGIKLPDNLLNDLDVRSMLEQVEFHLPPAITDFRPPNLGDQSVRIQELQASVAASVAQMQQDLGGLQDTVAGQVSDVQRDILNKVSSLSVPTANMEEMKQAALGQADEIKQGVLAKVSGWWGNMNLGAVKEQIVAQVNHVKEAVAGLSSRSAESLPDINIDEWKEVVLVQADKIQSSATTKLSDLPTIDVESVKASVVGKAGEMQQDVLTKVSAVNMPDVEGMKETIAGVQQGIVDKVSSLNAPDLNVDGVKESVLGQVNDMKQAAAAKTSSLPSSVNIDVGDMKETVLSKISSINVPELPSTNIDLEGVKESVLAKASSVKLPDLPTPPTSINVNSADANLPYWSTNVVVEGLKESGKAAMDPATVVESVKSSAESLASPDSSLLDMMPEYKWN